jgi:PleD family two-component response regulator
MTRGAFTLEKRWASVDELIDSAVEAAQSTIDAKRHPLRRAASDPARAANLLFRCCMLIADDNCYGAESMQLCLQMRGRDWIGGEALNVAQQIKPEIAVVDIGLPDTSGYDIAPHTRLDLGTRRATEGADRLGAGVR